MHLAIPRIDIDIVTSPNSFGYCVGLTGDDSAIAEAALVRCGVEQIVSTDVASFVNEFEDAARIGCVVMPLPDSLNGVRDWFAGRARRHSPVTSIFIAPQRDLPLVVEAVRCGAVDVLDQPIEVGRLEESVRTALEQSTERFEQAQAALAAQRKLKRLNLGEREVLQHMLAGRVNKAVASRLGIALRTVENRRKHVFTKLETRSLAEIVCLVQQANGMLEAERFVKSLGNISAGTIPELPDSSADPKPPGN